jgi:hypothetical protein
MSDTNGSGHNTDTEYLLFRTQIAGVFKAFDPWRVERLFAVGLAGEPLGKAIAATRAVDPADAFAATETLYNAARSAFDLPPLAADGSGVGEETVRRVLGEWLAWKLLVKKNTVSSPTSSGPTGPPSSAAP